MSLMISCSCYTGTANQCPRPTGCSDSRWTDYCLPACQRRWVCPAARCAFSFFTFHICVLFCRQLQTNKKYTELSTLNEYCHLYAGMITIPAASLAGAQIVQAGNTNTNTTTSGGQGTVTVTLPVSGNMVNAGGMVMVRPCAEVQAFLLFSSF